MNKASMTYLTKLQGPVNSVTNNFILETQLFIIIILNQAYLSFYDVMEIGQSGSLG